MLRVVLTKNILSESGHLAADRKLDGKVAQTGSRRGLGVSIRLLARTR